MAVTVGRVRPCPGMDLRMVSVSHNTLMVDGMDQSELQGAFLWGRRASATLETWSQEGDRCRVVGSHDGYTRLADPVVHRRTIQLQAAEGLIDIIDEVICAGSHEISIGFQFSEFCRLQSHGDHRYEVRLEGLGRGLYFSFPEHLEITLYEGSENPKGGWVSRGYHRKTPAPQLVLRGRVNGNTSLTTAIRLIDPA